MKKIFALLSIIFCCIVCAPVAQAQLEETPRLEHVTSLNSQASAEDYGSVWTMLNSITIKGIMTQQPSADISYHYNLDTSVYYWPQTSGDYYTLDTIRYGGRTMGGHLAITDKPNPIMYQIHCLKPGSGGQIWSSGTVAPIYWTRNVVCQDGSLDHMSAAGTAGEMESGSIASLEGNTFTMSANNSDFPTPPGGSITLKVLQSNGAASPAGSIVQAHATGDYFSVSAPEYTLDANGSFTATISCKNWNNTGSINFTDSSGRSIYDLTSINCAGR